MDGDPQEKVVGPLALVLVVPRQHMIVSMVCDVDAVMDEAHFRVEVPAGIRDEGVRLYTHRIEAGSNKVLPHHDTPRVVGDVDLHCCKEMANANTRCAAGLEAHEVAVPVNHSGRRQAQAVHGCC